MSKNYLSFSMGSEYGKILPTNVSLKNDKHRDYAGYSLQILKQTSGKNNWGRRFNDPQYGIGIFAFDFVENRKMGRPFGIYGIYNTKIRQWGHLKWYHNVNFGISFNSNRFDTDRDYHNISLGSKTNMFISLGTGMYYELDKHFDVGLHVKFNHLSNGALQMPNKGLNMISSQLSLVYHPDRAVIGKSGIVSADYKKSDHIEVSAFGGRKKVFYKGDHREDLKLYQGFNYSVYGTEVFYMRRYSPKSAYGIGMGMTMDEHYNHTMYVSDKALYQKKRFSNDQLLLSIIPIYRLMMGRLYLNIGAGYYVLKKQRKYDNSIFFQKIGLQCQITDRFFASFGINAYDLHAANYLEWKLGYTFSKKVRN
ncbi:acyloxyacyl hydrolase [Chryseobacterium herbae]|uniref:Acyloxyacyl hydrolase n=1 Tax=Chryseobacterium herbae TaxID=2976476 RepID=A0ABT2IQ42_9FLAO|nr:acyloxyacyl hydrolase [Chryseobacterium sp. pc1-10]MCT2560941.1 acyloxyacyl hydrolase [Chryseobacterium sp. pc1-10]